MSSVAISRTLAASAVLAAIAVVLWTGSRAPNDQPQLEPELEAVSIEPAPHDPVASPALARESAVAAKLAELNAMSETYRNTTFLIAIRDAGFVCNELLRVYGALDDAPKWLASCSEMLSYTVSVASTGTLRVEPMLQYFDGPVQRIQQQIRPEGPLPLQELVPPPTR